MMKRIKLFFAWFDMWVGFYWDRKKKILYFFPFPMVGIAFSKISKRGKE